MSPDPSADAFQGANHVLRSIAEARIDHRREARECVDHREHTNLLAGRQLVVDKVHRPRLVWRPRRPPIVAQLRLGPPLRRLVAQVQAKLPVNPVGLLDVDVPALATQQDVNAPIPVAHARGADLLDPGFEAGLIGAAGFAMVGGPIELQDAARAPDRYVPLPADPCRQLALPIRPYSFRRMTS